MFTPRGSLDNKIKAKQGKLPQDIDSRVTNVTYRHTDIYCTEVARAPRATRVAPGRSDLRPVER